MVIEGIFVVIVVVALGALQKDILYTLKNQNKDGDCAFFLFAIGLCG